MKKLRRFASSILALALVLAFFSCEKQEVDKSNQLTEVSFNITNLNYDLIKKADLPEDLPYLCVDDPQPVTVRLVLDGTTIDLDVLPGVDDGNQTEVMKLLPGEHTVTSFLVLNAEEEVIWAAPENGSTYAELFDIPGVSFTFTTEAFQKLKVEVPVLCYRDYAYNEFGFNWFQYKPYEVKTVCFFGDICSKFWEDFRDYENEANPYFGAQWINGYDFNALYEVRIFNGYEWVSANNLENPLAPLCIEYVDDLEAADQVYEYEISVYFPDGSLNLVYEGTFTDAQSSEVGNPDAFGGTDGIFDFVLGNCNYDGNDVNIELLPYLYLPTQGDIRVTFNDYKNNLPDYFRIDLIGESWNNPLYPEELYQGAVIGGFCGDLDNQILNGFYTVDIYSSLDAESIPEYYGYVKDKLGALHWLANNVPTESEDPNFAKKVQSVIWYVLFNEDPEVNAKVAAQGHPTIADPEVAQAVELALANNDYIPRTGEFSVLLFDSQEEEGQTREIQLVLVRVDP